MRGTSLSASKRVVGPRQAGLLAPDRCRWAPSQGTASVDLAHGSSVTVTGSRRIRTGFPFQLSISPSLHAGMEPLRATYRSFLTCRTLGPHHLPQKVTAL